MIGLDTETHPVTEDEPVPRLVCVSYALESGAAGLLDRDQGVATVRQILEAGETVCGHNIVYDFRVLVRAGLEEHLVWEAYDSGRVVDTQVKAWLDDIARGCYQGSRKGAYTLAALSARYLGEHLEKEDTWRLRYSELDGVPINEWPEDARDYAMNDAVTTLRVAGAIVTTSKGTPNLAAQCAHQWWLGLMATHGIATDPDRVKTLYAHVVADAARIAKNLSAKGWVSFDSKGAMHRHPSKVQAHMRAIGADSRKTKKGGISIDAVACEKSGDPDLVDYATLSRHLDAINKDSKYLLTPVIRCAYGLAESGRTTCWGPNLQNLKKDPLHKGPPILGIRECMVPRPGYVFAGADYDGLELRTMAQVCWSVLGQSRLKDILNAGHDPHCSVSAEILGCTYDEAVARKATTEGYRARQAGKVANFGFPGGLGAARLVEYAASPAYRVTLTEDEARALKVTWLNTFPEFRRYFEWISSVVDSGQPLEQIFSGRLRGGVGFTDAANSAFQGLGGDATKAAGFALTRECRIGNGPLRGCHPVVYVHDEFLLEVPEERAHECAIEMVRVMVDAANKYLPDVPAKASPYLARRWSKGAQAIWQDGRLVPWDG